MPAPSDLARKPLTPAESNLFAAIGLITAPATFFYLRTALDTARTCPSDTFWSGTDLPTTAILLGLLACITSQALMLCLPAPLFLWTELLPPTSIIRRLARHCLQTTAVALSCAILAALCWQAIARSSFCLSPGGVTIHRPFAADHAHAWSDLQAVQSDCSIAKTGRYAEFSLRFPGADPLRLTFRTDQSPAFEDLRAALSTTGYLYQPGDSVTAETCPPKLLPLLQHWGKPPSAPRTGTENLDGE